MRYIALLRGINVAGQNKIKMIDLKSMLESIGFKHVKTYIQSGNVIFDYETINTIELANEIENKINEIFGFLIKIIIFTKEELANIVNNNPYVKEPNIELDKLHATFMGDIPDPNLVLSLAIKKEENEKFTIILREVYLYCPNGYGRTKLTNSMFEKKFKTFATTRNWRTINTLLEMAENDIL